MKTRSHRWVVPDEPSLRRLLDYCCQHITEQDIRDHVPNDPGYADYIRALSQVLEIGRVPRRATFDIVESISLTNWGEAERERHPERFRRFRCFTCAVGVALLATGHDSDNVCAPNYLLLNLVRDAEDLGDRALQTLLPEVFESAPHGAGEGGAAGSGASVLPPRVDAGSAGAGRGACVCACSGGPLDCRGASSASRGFRAWQALPAESDGVRSVPCPVAQVGVPAHAG